MTKAILPTIRPAGVQRGIVMPNTVPPVTTFQMATDYRNELMAIEPNIDYKMLYFLCPELTMEDLEKAAASGYVQGVKSYPKGVTTNSSAGVESYKTYYPLFEKMDQLGLSLHLHGEVPGASVMLAEALFLYELSDLHDAFPNLKIVLEHVSTSEAVEMVKACGPTVAASVTAHHLDVTIDQVVGCGFNFCKPVPKLPKDRAAIREAVFSGNPKFFFGSDSAPHPRSKKEVGIGCAAGVFTGGYVIGYLADTFGKAGKLHLLPDFVNKFGREFLGHPPLNGPMMKITKAPGTCVPATFGEEVLGAKQAVVPFKAGMELDYKVEVLN